MRSDSLALGLILGLLAPVLGFFGYAAIYVSSIRPHLDLAYFINDLFLGNSDSFPTLSDPCNLTNFAGLSEQGQNRCVPDGVPDNVVRTVTENCRTLKFNHQGFETE